MHLPTSVATGLGHPDYAGNLGDFLSGSKWVSPTHILICLTQISLKTAMKRSIILSNRAVTNISRMRS